ncbi:stage V sporulation protein D (sporulation-specific penicillin-binding protein) [Butyrivibrio proteoclasticus]|uniref:Stage V sporulation protein D (Sporulation-specific penicillin-binding protein) n=1 Tax=Butyrivibrio proteoclasticus TaxID=43305 RepID=A0A1I5R754_9FIRM|nr:penicillin-binding transpeptidase domain-containing protein [Butyrivibrio proteoclasticus]SFP54121.1 stage V sporulation protein D (sporulation-specific penicillin-binding protein) [Butyrivibrio proteoclasticus]
MKRRKEKNKQKFTIGMRKKLVVLFVLVLLAFVGLGVRLILITKNNGEEYQKQVLSQQQYDSTTIPFRRGEILDANNTILAYSEKVYNVILDAKILLRDSKYLDPTLKALVRCFGLDGGDIRNYLAEHPSSQYYVLAKKLTYSEISEFQELITPGSESYDENIQGVWFEESYIRKYPNGTLASDIIGFTSSDNTGMYGLEEYYNNTLSGTPGREYGYLDDDSTLERTTISATDGDSIVTTIDGNLQTIVEKHLYEFNEQYKNNAREGNGANNVGCVIMDIHTGEVLAMASYPNFDLNNPRDTAALIGMPAVDEKGNKVKGESVYDSGVYITEEMLQNFTDEQLYQNYNALWKNFCIADTYEPGSVAKPFTVATGLESGSITGDEVYNCLGKLEVGGWEIKCHNTYGDGAVSVSRGIEISCNVAMMYISQAIGVNTFTKFQKDFGFGLKTNIDLAGEARTEGLTYSAANMTSTDLATNSFGQGFNVDMIEMITAFSSLINGGYYYEPHVVKKIVSSSGATIKNIEPRILRQTISQSTSDKIIEYCNQVVAGEEGTGKTARPAGYMIGGKTGTAQTLPRGNHQYVVSFMGYAPASDPDIAIYVVVDRPNVLYQDDAKFATRIVRAILTEALPYLNYPMTEELSEKEKTELETLREQLVTTAVTEEEQEENPEEVTEETGENQEETTETSEEKERTSIWESFDKDPATGYYVDPSNGNLIDPDSGSVIGGDELPDFEGVPTEAASESSSN